MKIIWAAFLIILFICLICFFSCDEEDDPEDDKTCCACCAFTDDPDYNYYVESFKVSSANGCANTCANMFESDMFASHTFDESAMLCNSKAKEFCMQNYDIFRDPYYPKTN